MKVKKFSEFVQQSRLTSESQYQVDQNNAAYQKWIKQCRKKYPDAQITGNSHHAQMVDWTTKDNKCVGEWFGDKGTIKEDVALLMKGSADAAYAALQQEVLTTLSFLTKTINSHAQKFKQTGANNWGFVGDLEHTNETLQALKSQFNNIKS